MSSRKFVVFFLNYIHFDTLVYVRSVRLRPFSLTMEMKTCLSTLMRPMSSPNLKLPLSQSGWTMVSAGRLHVREQQRLHGWREKLH